MLSYKMVQRLIILAETPLTTELSDTKIDHNNKLMALGSLNNSVTDDIILLARDILDDIGISYD